MNKNILKTVIADNQMEVPKHKVIPRDFTFEGFVNYVFVGIRRAGKSCSINGCKSYSHKACSGMKCFISILRMNALPEWWQRI